MGGLTLVVAAMPEEARPLLRRLADRRRVRPPAGAPSSLRLVRGGLGAEAVAVAVTGDGPLRAARGTRWALRALPAERLVLVGVAGGLAPELDVGHLVLAAEVRGEDGSAVSSAATEALARGAGARLGVVLTAGRLADTPALRRELAERCLPAGGTLPGVVELESLAVVREAATAGVPWQVVRAVSDTAAERLPACLEASRGTDGAMRRGAVLRHALRHPRVVPELLRLRARVRGGAERLADAVEALMAMERRTAARTIPRTAEVPGE